MYSRWWFLVIVLSIGLLLRSLSLGSLALVDPTEGRYATIAQQMYFSGDWITQQTFHDGKPVPFLGKPPLHAWATAASFGAFGLN